MATLYELTEEYRRDILQNRSRMIFVQTRNGRTRQRNTF